jgi:hypothetical protein
MIPGAFGSEIAKIPPMDEVLRRTAKAFEKQPPRRRAAESAEAAWPRAN